MFGIGELFSILMLAVDISSIETHEDLVHQYMNQPESSYTYKIGDHTPHDDPESWLYCIRTVEGTDSDMAFCDYQFNPSGGFDAEEIEAGAYEEEFQDGR